MYVHKQIIQKVTDLFVRNPAFRDERFNTVVLISQEIKRELQITDESSMIKVAFDVDRAFRYVQQHNPELRGTTWLQRQKQAGEIHDFNTPYAKSSNQLKLPFV